jgi:hypothetical protein
MIIVQFTEQEIAALRELIHRACLHSGMQVAEAAVTLTTKLNQAVESQQPPLQANGAARAGLDAH